jgi:hypothetical protein
VNGGDWLRQSAPDLAATDGVRSIKTVAPGRIQTGQSMVDSRPATLGIGKGQEDLRRQRKRAAASANCVPQTARPQKILLPCGQPRTKYLHCGKLRLMGIVGPVDNSVSRDSDRLLAVGAVTQSDRLAIELVQRPDTPAAILIKWPPQPTVTDPAKLTATIAAIVRVLGMAQIELAARRALRILGSVDRQSTKL